MQIHQNDIKVNLADNALFVRVDLERTSCFWGHWKVDRHSNAEYEMHIILHGTGQVDVKEQHYTLTKGQAILIPPNQHHNSRSLPGDFLRFSVPFFLPESPLSQQVQQQFPESHVFSITPEMESICHAIIAEYTDRQPFWRDRYPLLLSELMVCMFRRIQLNLDRHTEQLCKKGPSPTELIDDYLEKNSMHNVTVEDLAALLHLSRRQTNRVLQENYGMSFRTRLLNLRMDRAAWLLRTTTIPMSELIGIVGYTSEAAFYHAFRNHFQISPLQYRKHHLPAPSAQNE